METKWTIKPSYKLPFGMYKGKKIEQIPDNYLRWIAENLDEDTPLHKAICEACDKELSWRESFNWHIDDSDD